MYYYIPSVLYNYGLADWIDNLTVFLWVLLQSWFWDKDLGGSILSGICDLQQPNKGVGKWNRERKRTNKSHVDKPATITGKRNSILLGTF